MPYFVYIIQSQLDYSFYVGSTGGLENRLKRHNQGRSAYTKTKRPYRLVFSEEFATKSEAVKRENAIKRRKSRHYIETLIKSFKGEA